MYLFPTREELTGLYNQLSPKQRFLQAAREAINTMTEDAIIPYFDDIEDESEFAMGEKVDRWDDI